MATIRTRQLKDGSTTHQVLYRDGHRQSSRSFATGQGARDFIARIDAIGPHLAVAELKEAALAGTTLDDVADSFFTAKEKTVRSLRTVSDYRRDYRNWIHGTFGNRAAAGITDTDVQAWVDRLASATGKRHLSPKTIAGHHSLLHSIFKHGASRRLTPTDHDPCVGTSLPARVRRPPQPLRIDTWLTMHAALREKGARLKIGDDAADLGLFLIASGWRISEAIALDADGCEDDGQTITAYVLQVSRRQPDGTFRIVADAKSRAGGRRVRLDRETSAMVRRRLAGTSRGRPVFRRGSADWTYSTFRNVYWAGSAADAGISPPPKIHRLRHAAVGIFHESGASLAEIQRRIGHESIQTTIDVYGGMIDDMADESLDKVAAILRGENVRTRRS